MSWPDRAANVGPARERYWRPRGSMARPPGTGRPCRPLRSRHAELVAEILRPTRSYSCHINRCCESGSQRPPVSATYLRRTSSHMGSESTSTTSRSNTTASTIATSCASRASRPRNARPLGRFAVRCSLFAVPWPGAVSILRRCRSIVDACAWLRGRAVRVVAVTTSALCRPAGS